MSNIIYLFVLFLSAAPSSLLWGQQALIPLPVEVQWHDKNLSLKNGVVIEKTSSHLQREATVLHSILQGWGVTVHSASKKKLPTITLQIDKGLGVRGEGYVLDINQQGITVKSPSAKGVFYALQTLRQFKLNRGGIQYVSIKDEPAFSWRAFLIDVGRNFQPLEMIREQVDIMARYKLNVLHFHFTEDIAWRLQSDKYPGLTDASVMTRWKGLYYTKEDLKELIRYCSDRYITLLPEIDMPGHSAAFRRYFGVDMQSDSGMMYIKDLLSEFRTNFPELEYLHIGGDEVKITNMNFMPEITKYVEQIGYKKTIGWEPGSNLSPQTIRQLWMGGPKLIEEKGDKVYIESKHLYINHMDPLESVTTIFHRKIGEVDREHANLLGATLCSWPDRAVVQPRDMFFQSAIYPSILAFAERIWRGGGRAGWISNILSKDDPHYSDFVDFERRLLLHKELYFESLPFPYVKQTGIEWELIGPYDNGGDIHKAFEIEKEPFADGLRVYKVVEGGTVILRHWFGSIIETAIPDPKPNTTWYARTKLWSAKKGLKPFWIGFNDLSRSYKTDSPQLNTWDNKGSEVYVNGQRINPPSWKQAGQEGDLEIPLVDEGYAFREPTYVQLERGWNEVLIKIPVAEFRGRTWENPVKWMFTFIPVEQEK